VALTPVNQDFNVNNGLVVLGTSAVTSSTEQINALQVNAGAAIAQNLIVGTDGKIYGNFEVVGNTVLSTSTVNGDLTVTGEIIATRLTIQYTTVTTSLVTTDDIISTYNTTSSTSTDTGALVIAGGAGIGKDVFVGGSVTSAGFLGTATTAKNLEGGGTNSIPYQSTAGSTVFLPLGLDGTILGVVGQQLAWTSAAGATVGNATTATNLEGGSTGAIPYQSSAGQTTFDVNGLKYVSSLTQLLTNNISVTSSVPGTTIGGGAISVAGGAYFGKDVYIAEPGIGALTVAGYAAIGKRLTILDYTDASSTGTGALMISNGGAYISQNVYIGGAVTATNAQITSLGNNQLIYSDASGKLQNTVVSYSTQTFQLVGTITNALYAGAATYATSSSFATTSGYALSFDTSTLVTNALYAVTATYATNSLFATTSGYALSFDTSTLVTNALYAVTATYATSVLGFNTNTLMSSAVTATYAINVLGGAYGSVLYQTATNATAALPIGGEGTILAIVNGLLGWGNPSGFTVSTATNFNGGQAGSIPFQTASGQTSFDDANLSFDFPYTPNAILSANKIEVTSTTNSISSITGALVVSGGVGVKGDIYVGGTVYSNGQAVLTGGTGTGFVSSILAGAGISISSATGVITISNTGVLALTAGTDTAISTATGNITVWNNSTLQTVTSRGSTTDQIVTIINNTTASSTDSGSLIVYGGVGVGQNIYVGGEILVGGNIVPTTSTVSLGTLDNPFADLYVGPNSLNIDTVRLSAIGSTMSITVVPRGGVSAPATLRIGSVIITSTTNAISTITGALQVAGGIGIGRDIRVGNSAFIANTLTVSSTLSSTSSILQNALYVVGGVGIGKNLFVTGEAVFQSNVIFNGTTTFVLSTNTVYTDNIIELHYPNTPGNTWAVNDGSDIGLRFHYYDTQDRNAFLGRDNATGYLEWVINSNPDNTANIIGTDGIFRLGGIILTNTTASTNTSTGALTVVGGVGIGGDLQVGGTIYRNGISVGYGYTGSVGPQGPIGYAGSSGAGGGVGYDGSRGPQGPQGYTGSVGTQGPQGVTGPQGPLGYTGSVGPQGPAGFSGSGGAGGGTGYTGSVGPQGPQGYTGSVGPTGPQGLQGYDGSRGPQGPQGVTGPQGPIGYAGSVGAQGPIGYAGSVGAQGPQGVTGPQGPLGYAGSVGAQGPIGYAGSVGAQGPIGYAGSVGAQGPIGYAGSVGAQGPIGYAGSVGSTGTTGYSGSVGSTGTTGYSGSVGSTGTTGYSGSIGLTGTFTGTTTSTVFINNTTTSISTNTGALTVAGGVGVGGNIYFGGSLYQNGVLFTGGGSSATNFLVSGVSSNTPRYLTFVSTTTGYATAETSATSLLYVANRGMAIGTSTITANTDPMALSGSYIRGKVLDLYGGLYIRQVGPGIISSNYLGQGVYDSKTYINAGGVNNSFIWQINGSQKMYLSNAGYFGVGNPPISELHLHGTQLRHNDTAGWNTYTFTVSPGVVQLASTASFLIQTADVLVTSTASSISTTTGALVISGGVGVGGNVNIGGTVTGGGIRSTTTSTPPASPTVGDIWYIDGSDIIARFTDDGTTSAWIDITGPAIVSGGSVGPQGPQGLQGINGYAGSQGSAYDVAAASTGYFGFPVGTTAQRPLSSTATGASRINSDTGFMEIYYNSSWIDTVINFKMGQVQAYPAPSAAAIKSATGTTIDGFYWISLPGIGATYVYCDMNTSGGGWMLAAKVYNDITKFNGYNSLDWTDSGTFNTTQLPTFAGHIKTNVYNYWPITSGGLRLSMGTLSNNLYESWTGYTMSTLLNSTTQNSLNSRAQWLAWSATGGGPATSNYDNSPNCNQAGTNKSYSNSARIGISLNNENDCNSNDVSIGFGGNFGPCGWTTHSPNNSGRLIGWIWVK
jgi:hypothetical protein